VQEIDDDRLLPRSYKMEEIFCSGSTPPVKKLGEVKFLPQRRVGSSILPCQCLSLWLQRLCPGTYIKTRILYKRNIYLTHFSDFVSDVLWSLNLFCGRYELHEKLILPHEIHTVKKKGKN
jgi:hypothetical protein